MSAWIFCLLLIPAQEPDAEETVVLGRENDLIGLAAAASEGEVGPAELEHRPLLRPGEVLETIPGLVLTQHSGAGKANQFFLRGFNLDHGTDFATRLNGVPLNLPSHGHGQGYTDLNPLIPELLGGLRFRKGPYAAEVGDFASAGSADLVYLDQLPRAYAQLEAGGFGYERGLVADSLTLGGGSLLFGAEVLHRDGPWDVPEDHDEVNGLVRWSRGDHAEREDWTLEAYSSEWTATDQVAERAIDSGSVGRFGSLDPTDGGEASRFALAWNQRAGRTRLSAFAAYSELALYSNFTYFLANPVDGDQFLQRDQRVVVGFEGEHGVETELLGHSGELTFGLQTRHDEIDNGLFSTAARSILSTTRSDEISQSSAGLWVRHDLEWSPWFRTEAGLRGDLYRFEVDSDNADNSGTETDSIASPKLGAAFGPWGDTELYLNGGLGFHSNDARGVLLRDDPSTPAPGDGTPVDPLVRTKGAEVGLRTVSGELRSTVAMWILESDSELVFVGDAGNTEASRPSRRTGLELANHWSARDWLVLDADLSLSRARFRDEDPSGDHIPGSIESVLSSGVTLQSPERDLWATLRLRYFGPRSLIEDDSERSSSSLLLNLETGWRFHEHWGVSLGVFNLLDREVNDIEYFYASRLQGEGVGPDDGGFNDIHLHPAEPFTLRAALTARF